MTADRMTELFLYVVSQLEVDDDGLAPGQDLEDLNAAAFACMAMKAIAVSPDHVEDILLFDLADATEALIVTAAEPAESDVVTRFHRARAAVLQNRLSSM
jgi:hypothetical protein